MATTVTTATPMAASALSQLIRRYPLTAFFILAYALSWPYMLVDALGSYGVLSFRLPVLLWIPMGYGPTFAALIVAGALAGKSGIRALLGRLLIWRVGLPWYAVAIFGSIFLSFITIVLYAVLNGTPPVVPAVSAQMLLTAPLLFLVGGLVNGEEIGWRGFALPRLLAKHSALTASLILGSLWALFHLPLFFTRGDSFASTPPLSFLVRMIGAAILFTWVFNNTGGSLLLAYLMHAASNFWPRILPMGAMVEPFAWLPDAITILAVVLVVLIYGPAHLSRKAVRELPDRLASAQAIGGPRIIEEHMR
jgi:membrane protease YdiL (CAAX protease family)